MSIFAVSMLNTGRLLLASCTDMHICAFKLPIITKCGFCQKEFSGCITLCIPRYQRPLTCPLTPQLFLECLVGTYSHGDQFQ